MSVLARFGSALPSLDPLARLTDAARMRAVDGLVAARAAEVEECRRLCLEAPPNLRRIDEIARGALGTLREVGPLSALDAWVHRERLEILDGDDVDPRVRAEAMRRLEAVNDGTGAHAVFTEAIDRALGAEGGAHVYEVAAGTGGLARRMGSELRGRRPGLRWTVSDIDVDILAAKSADPQWLLRERRDALDLGGLDDVDLFICVQATHHFSPGLVVAVLAQARCSRLGMLVLDVHRGGLVAGAAGIVGTVVGRNRIVALDGMRSARRAYTPAELSLLARFAGVRVVRSGPVGPAYLALHVVGS